MSSTSPHHSVVWLVEIVKQLIDARFYGKLTLSFEAGRLTCAKREETLKPPAVRP